MNPKHVARTGRMSANNLAEVPMAGKMLCSEEKLSSFLTWKERANMLAGNAISLFDLGPSFKQAYLNRLNNFDKKSSLVV